MLTTANDVIRRTDIAGLPQYEEQGPMTDCAGFYAFRPYPAGSQLAAVLTSDGRAAVRCLTQFIVDSPQGGGSISKVILRTRFSRRWHPDLTFVSGGRDPYAHDPGDPDAPAPQSAALLAKARKPLDLNFLDEYIYDQREGVFMNDRGAVVNPAAMLEDAYTKHCRTYQLGFQLRWRVGSGARLIVRRSVWGAQDVAMWLLLTLYDVELEDQKRRNPFHKYKPTEFRRVTEKQAEGSHFFGFQSSQKTLFTNLIVVSIVCALLYWKGSHTGIVRAIYNNNALTTAALVFAFLMADFLGPWILIRSICGLSRFREVVIFFTRKVNV